MSEFAHSWKGADQSNVRKKCSEGQAQRQWRNKMERIKRIQSGVIQEDDRDSLIRYHRDAVRRGEFSGSLEDWLSIHKVTLPPVSSRVRKAAGVEEELKDDLVSQAQQDAVIKALGEEDGPWVLWALLIAGKQLPPVPRPQRRDARMIA